MPRDAPGRLERRPHLTPWRYQDLAIEDERAVDGSIARTATVLLTGRECPWRCVMCDLWRGTIPGDTPRGAIPAQVSAARRALRERREAVSQMKLYNASNFFDPLAVPDQDYEAIARQLDGVGRVIVESHPTSVVTRTWLIDRFGDALERTAAPRAVPPQLEVAMVLETAHPESLERLNKRMRVEEFSRAARALSGRGVALRAFLLIGPPFVPWDEQDGWLARSIDVAFASGASVVVLIPTRPGNGALEALAAQGQFHAPRLSDIERSAWLGHSRRPAQGRLFVDLWDLECFSTCPLCLEARRARLHAMNLGQRVLPAIWCAECEGGSG